MHARRIIRHQVLGEWTFWILSIYGPVLLTADGIRRLVWTVAFLVIRILVPENVGLSDHPLHGILTACCAMVGRSTRKETCALASWQPFSIAACVGIRVAVNRLA